MQNDNAKRQNFYFYIVILHFEILFLHYMYQHQS